MGIKDDSVAGPLLGGGAAQVGILATRYFLKTNAKALKYAGLIGTAVGMGVGALLYYQGRKQLGQAAMVTAALIGLPRQLESFLPAGTLGDDLLGDDNYLGVITPEYEMQGAGDVQILEGASNLGLITAEQEMNGAEGVELLDAGFGSNFLASA